MKMPLSSDKIHSEPTIALKKGILIDALLANRISIADFESLRKVICPDDLAEIIQRIYDLNNEQINRIAALGPFLAKINALKNSQRNGKFRKKVKGNFRGIAGNKVVVVEGDSWFNYPVILSDVIDWVGMETNIAVYSVASGGDWLLNMLSARKYVEQLSTLRPDVFIISGGGNDLVGNNRLAAVVDAGGNSKEFQKSDWAIQLIKESFGEQLREESFNNGCLFLSKDFFALLMFFQLQYYYIFNGILTSGTNDLGEGKFNGIRIITQGYDYVIPSDDLGFGINPLKWFKPFARMFLGHGSWLKRPLELRGIWDSKNQRDIMYAMITLFNQMMIQTGALFCKIAGPNTVCHVDSRGSIDKDGWTDELHPLPENFKTTGLTFIDCINCTQTDSPVYRVKDRKPKS